MPELPEVETVMRGLSARLLHRRITRAVLNRADMRWPFPPSLAEALTGATVASFRRRGKYILMRLSGTKAADGRSVLIHLGMSGRMVLSEPGLKDGRNKPDAHEHLEMLTDEGWHVGFVDPRRFGSVDLLETASEDSHKLLGAMGPEPLSDDFTLASLNAALEGKKTPIKSALLDQSVVAGLGNIYVCEALFRAGISPQRIAATVPGARAARLVPEIKQTLEEAVAAGGSSLRDYVQPDGELGYFQHAWKVYGREGELCERCPGAPGCAGIKRIVQAGRSTFYCPRTQR